jgi:hypothetical protein
MARKSVKEDIQVETKNIEKDQQTENENVPGLVEINVGETNTNIEEKPKRQYKKREKKEDVKQSSNSFNDSVKDISNLLVAGFGILSLKMGEHWQISIDEAISVATPAARIMERYNLLEKASKVSDPLSLIIASGMITIPRLMISQQLQKEKNSTLIKEGKIKDGTTNNISTEKRKVNESNQQINGEIERKPEDNISSISSLCQSMETGI